MSERPNNLWMQVDWSRGDTGEAMARIRRWTVAGKAKVTHPDKGAVVVPCASNLAAMLCAMEFWGLPETELGRCKCFNAGPEDGPVRRPKNIYTYMAAERARLERAAAAE